MTKRKTDGEKIADGWFDHDGPIGLDWEGDLARAIDRAIRRRQAEAWDAGYESHRDGVPRGYDANPYRGKR